MLPSTYAEQHCAVARALEDVGERWTLLIVRDALMGIRRFEDFQARLGVSRPVLSDRLRRLVDNGVLQRVRYQQRPDRHEYVLTDSGRELWPVIAALAQWGASQLPGGAPREFRHAGCRAPAHAEVRCPDCGEALEPAGVLTRPAPGAPLSRAEHVSDALRAALGAERPLLQPVHAA